MWGVGRYALSGQSAGWALVKGSSRRGLRLLLVNTGKLSAKKMVQKPWRTIHVPSGRQEFFLLGRGIDRTVQRKPKSGTGRLFSEKHKARALDIYLPCNGKVGWLILYIALTLLAMHNQYALLLLNRHRGHFSFYRYTASGTLNGFLCSSSSPRHYSILGL